MSSWDASKKRFVKPEECENGERVILSVPVLWQGWEMDNLALVVERPDGSRYLRTTNHGAIENRADSQFLIDRLEEYAGAAELTTRALELLGERRS